MSRNRSSEISAEERKLSGLERSDIWFMTKLPDEAAHALSPAAAGAVKFPPERGS
jgi:hypothetical protein